jgi:hypothetical protein
MVNSWVVNRWGARGQKTRQDKTAWVLPVACAGAAPRLEVRRGFTTGLEQEEKLEQEGIKSPLRDGYPAL